MLTILNGVPGTGKTLYTVHKIRDEFLPSGRPVYVCGLEVDLDGVQQLDFAKDWVDCPEGSIVVIDEAADYFPARGASKDVPATVQEMRKHRHKGIDLWLAVQDVRDLDVAVRRQCTQYLELSRPAQGTLLTIREYPRCKHDHENTRQTGVKTWRYDKSLYGLYDSAVMHTHKFKLNGKGLFGLLLLGAAVSLIVWGGWGFYSGFLADGGSTTAAGALVNGAKDFAEIDASLYRERVSGSFGGSDGSDREFSGLWDDDAAAWVPAVSGKPWTAPVFAEYWEDEGVAPRFPEACVIFTGKTGGQSCKCWDADAVRVQVGWRLCRSYASGGFPDPRGVRADRGGSDFGGSSPGRSSGDPGVLFEGS